MNAYPPLQLLAAFLAVLAFASFALSVVLVFRTSGDAGRMLDLLKIGALGTAVIEVWAILQPGAGIGWNGVLGCVGLGGAWLLFLWTAAVNRRRRLSLAFSPDLPSFLMRNGPYRFLRHPFYFSYLFAYGSAALAAWHPLPLGAVVVMWLVYWAAASREERKFASSGLRAEYAEYRKSTWSGVPGVGVFAQEPKT
ncbi:MAG: methyltransferase [Bdellovibrionota bacterium]